MLTRRLMIALAIVLIAAPALALQAARGAPDEAVAMVEAANDMYKATGAEAAFAAIMDPNDARFHDRVLDVGVMDFDVAMLAHGAQPRLVGRNLTNLTDPGGVEYAAELVRTAREKGAGWVSFRWWEFRERQG